MELRASKKPQHLKRGLVDGSLASIALGWLDTYNHLLRDKKGKVLFRGLPVRKYNGLVCAVIGWNGGGVNTSGLAKACGWTYGMASRHLRHLARQGWVYNTRKGGNSLWRLSDEGRAWFEQLRRLCGAEWNRGVMAVRVHARESIEEELRGLGWMDGGEVLAMRVELHELRKRVEELGG